MKIRKNIAVSEEGFIFNPTTGDSFSTNKVGTEIINLLKQGKTLGEVKETITLVYDVDEALFERDLEDFMMFLKEFGIAE